MPGAYISLHTDSNALERRLRNEVKAVKGEAGSRGATMKNSSLSKRHKKTVSEQMPKSLADFEPLHSRRSVSCDLQPRVE